MNTAQAFLWGAFVGLLTFVFGVGLGWIICSIAGSHWITPNIFDWTPLARFLVVVWIFISLVACSTFIDDAL